MQKCKYNNAASPLGACCNRMLQGLCYAAILQGIFKVILSVYTNEGLYSVFINYESICSIEAYACSYFCCKLAMSTSCETVPWPMPWQLHINFASFSAQVADAGSGWIAISLAFRCTLCGMAQVASAQVVEWQHYVTAERIENWHWSVCVCAHVTACVVFTTWEARGWCYIFFDMHCQCCSTRDLKSVFINDKRTFAHGHAGIIMEWNSDAKIKEFKISHYRA